MRIVIDDGKTKEEHNSSAKSATFFDPGRTVATDAGPAPKSPEMSVAPMGPMGTLVNIIPDARVLDAGPPPKSLIELIKSATIGLSTSSAYDNDKDNALDAGKAPL